MSIKTSIRIERLLKTLADGQFHSGETIATALGVSRTAVWKLIQKLQAWQLTVFSVRGRGYQIPGGLDLLDQAEIQRALEAHNQLFSRVLLLTSIDSTSNYLADDWKKAPGRGRVCIAEHQTAGRGRKGRPWISPFGANLYFSIGVELPLGLSALGGLSLAVGVNLCQTLNAFTTQPVKIKWPNDLLLDGKKLAGILVEASGDTSQSSFLNIGVGINWAMSLPHGESIEQPWTNLQDFVRAGVSRKQILTALLMRLDTCLLEYLKSGIRPVTSLWPELSAYYQKEVAIQQANQTVIGIEAGIEPNGALQLISNGKQRVFHSGEVSLRRLKK